MTNNATVIWIFIISVLWFYAVIGVKPEADMTIGLSNIGIQDISVRDGIWLLYLSQTFFGLPMFFEIAGQNSNTWKIILPIVISQFFALILAVVALGH